MMIEEENQNLTIERNTVPLPEDTTNIMEMIENASFDFTLPEPFPTTTLHISEQKTEVEQMVEVINNNNNTETVWAGVSFDDPNLGLCLPAFEAEGRIELPVNVANNNNNNGIVESTGRARLAGRRGRGSWPRRRRSWPPCSRRTSSCRPSSRIWRRRWPHTRKGSLSRSPE